MSMRLVSLVLEEYQGTTRQRLVLMALAKHANDDGSSCFPSVKKLAKVAGVCIATVQRALPELADQGAITILHKGGATGRGDHSRYKINVENINKDRTLIPLKSEKGRNLCEKGSQLCKEKGCSVPPDSVSDSIINSVDKAKLQPNLVHDGRERASDDDLGRRAFTAMIEALKRRQS